MPKSVYVELIVPSGSRPSALLGWLNKLLSPHRMSALTVEEVQLPLSYIVARGPSTQEDEGRSFIVGTYSTPEAAAEAKQLADGYYTHHIYRRID